MTYKVFLFPKLTYKTLVLLTPQSTKSLGDRSHTETQTWASLVGWDWCGFQWRAMHSTLSQPLSLAFLNSTFSTSQKNPKTKPRKGKTRNVIFGSKIKTLYIPRQKNKNPKQTHQTKNQKGLTCATTGSRNKHSTLLRLRHGHNTKSSPHPLRTLFLTKCHQT